MAQLAIGSARINWSMRKFPAIGEKKMLVIDAPKANPRSQKHAQVMLSEYQVVQLQIWLNGDTKHEV